MIRVSSKRALKAMLSKMCPNLEPFAYEPDDEYTRIANFDGGYVVETRENESYEIVYDDGNYFIVWYEEMKKK